MKKKIASGAALAAALLLVYVMGLWYPLSRVNATEPDNTSRVVTGWLYAPDVIEDETGNLWGYDSLTEDGEYLIEFDTMGTPNIEDDEIINIWKKI